MSRELIILFLLSMSIIRAQVTNKPLLPNGIQSAEDSTSIQPNSSIQFTITTDHSLRTPSVSQDDSLLTQNSLQIENMSQQNLVSDTAATTLTSGSKSISIPSQEQVVKERKPNVAILEFTGSYKIFSREEIQSITNRFETELMKTDSFTVLERRNMDVILQEQGFQQTGACNNAECQIQVGQLLGVDRIILGEVSKVGSIISLNVKMIDVATGTNVLSHVIDIKGDLQDVLRGGCYEMVLIISGIKIPEGNRSILSSDRSIIWPWILGGLGLAAIGIGSYIVFSNDDKNEDYEVTTGF